MIENEQMNDLQLEDVEDYSADYPPAGYPSAEANMAPMANADEMSGYKSVKYRRSAIQAMIRNNKWSFAVLGLVIIVLIGVLAAAVGKDEAQPTTSEENAVGVPPPPTVDSASLDQDVLSELKASLQSVFSRHEIDSTVLDESAGETPQRKAMLWMALDKNVNSEDHTEKLQRFVLAVLFFSTNMVAHSYAEDPPAWLKADNWITNAHSCDWMGVVCNDDKVITQINLERNRLTGKLPQELAIVGKWLETLDFTSNALHMSDRSDYNMFKYFQNMKTLLMDDNYMYYSEGLPQQWHNMANLEKLRVSYNLFEGQLDSANVPVLAAMTKLTHLEVESNFLTGSIPATIGNMDQLVYLYLRRNNMKFNLNFLKTGQLVNLFALWLDSNAITGIIPSEIGLLTGLASLSMTNATLTGKIPDEIGNLSDLRRLWLYNNQLTGTIPESLNNLKFLEVVELHNNNLGGEMPQGVCSAVSKSDYDYKSLTSDCVSEVDCDPSCCTQCF